MTKLILALTILGTFPAAAGAFKPTVWADVPDVAPLRVGGTYYMVSTTMHMNPGIPVMASTNLVDWSVISYCYGTIEDRPEDRLEEGKDDYKYGTWASSIRYNEADGCFYVSSFNARARHTYLFRTKDPAGKWDLLFRHEGLVYDHSLWIEDGKFYFFASEGGKVYLHRIKDDLSGVEPGKKLVCASIVGALGNGLGEGTQVFKKDGWYYLVNICWPRGRCRLVNVHRARSLEGPFEENRVAFEHEGIAQGSFVEKPDGSWVAVLFGDRGGVGRIPFVLPVDWEGGWPVVRKENIYAGDFTKLPGCVDNDDFSSDKLKLVWQWNHNPDDANWKLDGGKLAITASRVDDDLLKVRNQLTQRTFGPTSVATVTVDGAALKEGDKAGLSLFQHHWHAISLQKTPKGYDIVLDQSPLAMKDRHSLKPTAARPREVMRRSVGTNAVVRLRAVCDFTPWANPRYSGIPDHEDAGRFYYSLDGVTWEAIGEAVWLPYTIPHFTGYRFGLFNWATREAGGTAFFDDFELRYAEPRETLKMDGTNPLVKTRFTADPAAVVDGEWLYVFMGHDDATARGYKMHDWSVVRTKNLTDWEDLGAVMSVRETFPWAKPDKAWASQAIKRNGKWYWYVAISPKGRGEDTIGIAVADRPEGPWKDALGHGLVSGRGYIDPSVFVDDDGKAWLFWGNCGGNPGCWYAELKDNMVELAGEVKPVPGLMDEAAFGKPLKKAHGAGAYKPIDTNFEEAPWIYKLGNTYYLEYAAGGVPENWSYSTAPSVHGPWTYRGKIMENAGGTGTIHGGSVFFKGQWLMLYHDGNLPGGGDCRRSVCLEPYVRNPDGSIPFITPTSPTRVSATRQQIDLGWEFALCDAATPEALAKADADWRRIDLPHDWSVEGAVSRDAATGNDGGYFPSGTGWYRRNWEHVPSADGGRLWLYFEGVYERSEVWVNGRPVGGRPYGFMSFACDVTDAVEPGVNRIEVRVDNSRQRNCRWYSGSGIYRHVWLIEAPAVRVERPFGAFLSTPSFESAHVRVPVVNDTAERRVLIVRADLDALGAASATVPLEAHGRSTVELDVPLRGAEPWSPRTPRLYTASIRVAEKGKTLDVQTFRFGVRTLAWSAERGLLLNGERILLNGACVHHDNGILGARAFDDAEKRRVRLLKEAGFNAVRTAHNPPSEAFLDVCDELGLLVVDEAFDGWLERKNAHDYADHFAEWAERDMRDMVLRDRNHPSVFCWSTGNEILERKSADAVAWSRRLAAVAKRADGTRPVTNALASWDDDWEIYDPLAAEYDIVGYNYMMHKADGDHARVPSRVMMQTESYPRDAFANWQRMERLDCVVGDFVWTGIDYLGESGIGRWWYDTDTPGEHYTSPLFPWHGSFCGDLDLTGRRKPISHYRALLHAPSEKLYMAVREPGGYAGKGAIHTGLWAVWPTWESWNWPGHEGKDIEVEVYSRCARVRLSLNGAPVGEKPTTEAEAFRATFTLPYAPGTLRAEGLDADGAVVAAAALETSGAPAALRLIADRARLEANGQDLAFVDIEVVDDKGRVVSDAAAQVALQVAGEATLAGAGNADLRDTTPYATSAPKTWKGRAQCVLRATTRGGDVVLTASSPGLREAKLAIQTVRTLPQKQGRG